MLRYSFHIGTLEAVQYIPSHGNVKYHHLREHNFCLFYKLKMENKFEAVWKSGAEKNILT
jgi:hypothetical protein